MITHRDYEEAKKRAAEIMEDAGVVVSDNEINHMDIADFGLSDLMVEGAQIVSLFETNQVAARIIVLFPYQTEPEHWHIGVGDMPGKQETLRVIKGNLLVFCEGRDTMKLGKIPDQKAHYYTCRHEVLLKPCETITFQPGEKHWFQAMEEECVFYTMSTVANDTKDLFTNPSVVRVTKIIE